MLRNKNLDILRALATFLVVAIHCNYKSGDTIDILLQSIFRAGLPVFFVLSGFFILNSKISNLLQWYWVKLLSITLPFLVYALFYYLSENSLSSLSIIEFFKVISQNPTGLSTHFWFIYTILGLYFFAPALEPMIRHCPPVDALRSLIVLVVIQAFVSNYQLMSLITDAPNLIVNSPFTIWTLYFVSGGLLARCHSSLTKRIGSFLIISGFIVTFGFSFMTPNGYNFQFGHYDTNASMLVYTLGLVLFFTKMSKVNKHVEVPATFIAKHSYGIYLIHILVLKYFIFMIGDFYNEQQLYYGLSSVALAIMIFLISLLLSWLISYPVDYFTNKVKRIIPE
ncbi:acyltransferase [Vibrio comitans]